VPNKVGTQREASGPMAIWPLAHEAAIAQRRMPPPCWFWCPILAFHSPHTSVLSVRTTLSSACRPRTPARRLQIGTALPVEDAQRIHRAPVHQGVRFRKGLPGANACLRAQAHAFDAEIARDRSRQAEVLAIGLKSRSMIGSDRVDRRRPPRVRPEPRSFQS
jgi:hypothetical protein